MFDYKKHFFLCLCFLSLSFLPHCLFAIDGNPLVSLGVNVFFDEQQDLLLKNKRIGLVINQTSVDNHMRSTLQRFLERAPLLEVVAIFTPEHGLLGKDLAGEKVNDSQLNGLPIYSLHGTTRRPTSEMLNHVDALVFDIQCVGSRGYTYPTTLFYVMEEAAKLGKQVIVFDRPNPINGITIDGPMLEEKWRSFVGYVNVPYCHGMTIGELARFFNAEYQVGCDLKVIPMHGYRRWMTYQDTGLSWVPPSPNIPECDTPFYFPSTGILGCLGLVNIGIGYTMPFKIVGAPWIDSQKFASKLNEQRLSGVYFLPYSFKPFYGLYKDEECHGVLIRVTDPLTYHPVSVQYLLLGLLKSMYASEITKRLTQSTSLQSFHQANGTEAIYQILLQEKYPTWKLLGFQQKERKDFEKKRLSYLIKEYSIE